MFTFDLICEPLYCRKFHVYQCYLTLKFGCKVEMSVKNVNSEKNLDTSKRISKRDQEFYNACWKEHNLTLKCLNQNDYNSEKCVLYFENYKICKKFWGQIVSYRRGNNITPWLPLPEDREKVKAEFLNS